MVIAIRNFKMQDSCYNCPFCDYEFEKCLADIEQRYTEGYAKWNPEKQYSSYILITRDVKIGKPEWCPLYEIEEDEV